MKTNTQKRKRGRPFEVDWQETTAELKKRYQKETDGHRKQRLQALWLLRKGVAMQVVSDHLGITYRSLQRWVAKYRSEGLEAVVKGRSGAQPGQGSYLTAQQQKALIAKANLGEWQRAADAVRWVKDRWGIEYTVGSMQSLFRRLKLSKKVPRRQAAQANVPAQQAWKKGA